MHRHTHLLAVALAGASLFACEVGGGVGPGAQQPAQPMPGEPQPATGGGGSGAGAVAGGPNCPTPANHCLDAGILFAGKKAYQQGYIYVDPATMTAEPGPSGEATFMSLRDGGTLVTGHFWRTQAAQQNQLTIGTLAVMMHRSSQGVYVAPTSRDEAHKHRWWVSRIVSNKTLDNGYVHVTGGHKINANAIRIIDGDQSPTIASSGVEDDHFVQDDHWLVAKKALPDKGYVYASLALAAKPPTAETGGEGQFLQTRDGQYVWSRHAWRTRRATQADVRPGMHVFMIHRSKSGVYVAPESRAEALAHRWWTAKVVDTSELYKGVVEVAGGHKVALAALRVPI